VTVGPEAAAGAPDTAAAPLATGAAGAPVALVTGAARGLGAAVAAVLDRDGFRLVLTDLADGSSLPYPMATAEDLRRVGKGCRDAVTLPADVRVQGELDAAVRLALARFGRLDAAVAVAGVTAGGPPLWETDDETWRVVLETDLTGVFHLARAAVPALLAAPAGRFVAISSAAGTRPLPRLAAYAAAKHGVVGLVTSLAADLAGTSVTANVVCPGSMDTAALEASARIYGLADPAGFASHAMQRRILPPAEVAEAVGWLCSPAAGALTGAVVPVDAGFRG
jgi:SDR family mycofactocin-dependent oxidoreductase